MPILDLTDEQLVELIKNLSPNQKSRVLASLTGEKTPRTRPQFGSAKSDILYIAEDFDAPLDDFKEYME
jgi:hypothetical protein